jgi:nucleoside-triphosphatase
MLKNILITGMPRSGKSTLLKNVVLEFSNKVGFVTNEVRKDDERTGFEIELFSGKKIMLADVNFSSPYKVSRYFVDLHNLDYVLPKITLFKDNDLLYLDEIGQMELFSDKFKEVVLKFLTSTNICLATLSKVYSDDFTQALKNRNDVILVEVTEGNRNEQVKFVRDLIDKIMKAKKYLSDHSRFIIKDDKVVVKSDHGIRELIRNGHNLTCNCQFFMENKICSHFIAAKELLKI